MFIHKGDMLAWMDKPIAWFLAYVMVWWYLFFSTAVGRAGSLGPDINKVPTNQVRAMLRSIAFEPTLLVPTLLVGAYAVVRLFGLHGRRLTLYEKLAIGFIVFFVGLVHLVIAF